ncbi:MAG: hypothetical protein JSS79_18830 [Bacteroidetes bacterium]|nr:hypothetical protein [Bacteroidota bacterium]
MKNFADTDRLIHDAVKERIPRLATRRVTLGFDGFVDEIVKPIRTVSQDDCAVYFSSIREFGEFIVDKSDKNFAIELEQVITKIGGNMPIMACAFAALGPVSSCVGTLGFPHVHPVFEKMPASCSLYTFANPGFTKAVEFGGSKILMAEMGDLNHVSWNTVMETVGPDVLRNLFLSPDMICLLNWSELKHSNAIWKGILTDLVMPAPTAAQKKFAFIDLADCSRKAPHAIEEAIALVQQFSTHWNVVLGMNLNEAIHVHRVLSGESLSEKDIEHVGERLYQRLGIHSVVIHYSRQALAWDAHGMHQQNSRFIANPKLSTGAGDNFNAGYCAGLLMELDASASLRLGHAVSGFYMQQGRSPQPDELLSSLG